MSPKYHQESECNYLLLLFGCLIYAAVLLFWLFGYGDTTFMIFGGISALITILNSYDSGGKPPTGTVVETGIDCESI
ncbi:hypothetical protein [Rhodohalobacter sp. SW132]|uniref:hypothetical protein n=1 Tax=Rhodohalobacter sp. SW132 TaxID=2293433 RepID=UPI0011C06C2E|nr:hypothetical protein [Rhodohalobacter sp. SW132]